MKSIVPAADKAGIQDIGNEDHVRQWVSASLLQKRCCSALSAVLKCCEKSNTGVQCSGLREVAAFMSNYCTPQDMAQVHV